MKKRPFQSPLADNLRLKIYNMIEQSPYHIISFHIDEKRFGNVFLELQNHSQQIRFIQDRGDVYVEKKGVNNVQWDEFLFVPHKDSPSGYYDSFLDSLTLVLKTQ